MNITTTNDIFYETTLSSRLILSPGKLKKNMNSVLKEILINTVEGKCVREGYVESNSVEVIKRSVPYLYGNQLNGKFAIDVFYKAKICCPMRGNIIDCKIEKINKLGILASNGPLYIIVAKQFHDNKKVFKDLKENQTIKIRIIDKKFNVNEEKISVIAEIYEKDSDKSVVHKETIESESESETDNVVSSSSEEEDNDKNETDDNQTSSDDEEEEDNIEYNTSSDDEEDKPDELSAEEEVVLSSSDEEEMDDQTNENE